MIFSLLASAALGLVKGLTSSTPQEFSWEQDLIGPAREELVYRAAPLWLFPNIPYGSTAIVFAAAHLEDDLRRELVPGELPSTPMQVLARLGDTFLGGWLYEMGMRSKGGVAAAIGAHSIHNLAVALGSRLR